MFTKALGIVFWLTFGTLGLLSSGWFIYFKLEHIIRREVFGRDLYPHSPDNWLFFFGCVVIFFLCAYGIWKALTRPVGKAAKAHGVRTG